MPNTAPLLSRCWSSILLTSIALSAVTVTAHAGNMYIYKDQAGQVLLTNVSPSGNFDKFTKKVKVTYYKDAKVHESNRDNTYNNYGTSTASKSSSRNAYDSYIRASATRHGVDPGLMKAMMHTESAFNPNARSPVGAQGLMQLMPGTAKDLGVANSFDPRENVMGGAKYLSQLMTMFDGNLTKVLAGYNAGPGNVQKYGGVPPFKETQDYLEKVLNNYSDFKA